MEESYIRGVNQEIIRYLKDIKSGLSGQTQNTLSNVNESESDLLSESIASLSTTAITINDKLSDIVTLLQEIREKLANDNT